MAYDDKTKQMKPNATAPAKAKAKTAGPNGSFPIGDAKHARLAVGAATRSERAGHISPSTEASIKAKARAVLAKPVDHMAAAARHSAMADRHRAIADKHMADGKIQAIASGAKIVPSEYGGTPTVAMKPRTSK